MSRLNGLLLPRTKRILACDEVEVYFEVYSFHVSASDKVLLVDVNVRPLAMKLIFHI